MTVNIDEGVRLELIAQKHSKELYAAIDSNREHLSEFLAWVGNMQSVNDMNNYIKNCKLLYQQKQEVSFVIVLDDVIVGRIGLHSLNLQDKNASIGYWLTKNAEGQGIVYKSCKALIQYGFQQLCLHRIEIRIAAGNLKSQAVPIKLNFKKEGILRQAEWVNNTYLDVFMYSMLDSEWME